MDTSSPTNHCFKVKARGSRGLAGKRLALGSLLSQKNETENNGGLSDLLWHTDRHTYPKRKGKDDSRKTDQGSVLRWEMGSQVPKNDLDCGSPAYFSHILGLQTHAFMPGLCGGRDQTKGEC